MAKFIPGETTGDVKSADADDNTLEVVVDAQHQLEPGAHVFCLVVADNGGNVSDPQQVVVLVLDRARATTVIENAQGQHQPGPTSVQIPYDRAKPTAVIEVINAQGQRQVGPAIQIVQIPFGDKFQLTGNKSTDIGGTIESYTWTLVQ